MTETEKLFLTLKARLAHVLETGVSHNELYQTVAEEAGIDARSVYNFIFAKKKGQNPRLSTLQGIERALAKLKKSL